MKGIGNTPLIKLERITEPGWADVYVKYEGANPTGSMKDRMALSMILGAEKRGDLKPGGRVVDFTGGSTGSSLAMVCSAKGYQACFVSSDAFAAEKLQTMRAFGATLELIPSDSGKISKEIFTRGMKRIEEMSHESNTFWTNQFHNPDNRLAYHALAREIMDVLGEHIDEFVTGVGTGGSFSGTSEVFKEINRSIRCIAVEPFFLRTISNGDQSGSHRLEGIGTGIKPSIFRDDLVDDVIAVRDEDAFDTARTLARKEGIFGGITSGANVWAALQRAKVIGKGKSVVTIICDTGLKYLNGDLYK